MRHERIDERADDAERLDRISREIAGRTAASPDPDGFPRPGFDLLQELGLCARPPIEPGKGLSLLRLLAAVGRGDLGLGRLYEGHVNALDLVRRFGSPQLVRRVGGEAQEGALYGVWNTDQPGDPLQCTAGALAGKKNFASGVDGLSCAIVTAPTPAGRQMFLVRLGGVAVDRSWWRPLGMKSSGSHVVDFASVASDDVTLLGEPGDYIAEPWFSGGAIRFAAVQVGGMQAVMDAALDHLKRTGRADNPHQAHRLGRMGLSVETGHLWLRSAAAAWDAAEEANGGEPQATRLRAVANGFRSVVENAAMSVLDEAERAVGAAGFNAPHRLERLIPDLRTYLRQPNPDGALTGFSQALVEGTMRVGL